MLGGTLVATPVGKHFLPATCGSNAVVVDEENAIPAEKGIRVLGFAFVAVYAKVKARYHVLAIIGRRTREKGGNLHLPGGNGIVGRTAWQFRIGRLGIRVRNFTAIGCHGGIGTGNVCQTLSQTASCQHRTILEIVGCEVVKRRPCLGMQHWPVEVSFDLNDFSRIHAGLVQS